MRNLFLLSILLGATALTTGCGSTPALSSRERFQLIDRNIHYEGAQAMDDLDHALLLRPAGRLTIWNVR